MYLLKWRFNVSRLGAVGWCVVGWVLSVGMYSAVCQLVYILLHVVGWWNAGKITVPRNWRNWKALNKLTLENLTIGKLNVEHFCIFAFNLRFDKCSIYLHCFHFFNVPFQVWYSFQFLYMVSQTAKLKVQDRHKQVPAQERVSELPEVHPLPEACIPDGWDKDGRRKAWWVSYEKWTEMAILWFISQIRTLAE